MAHLENRFWDKVEQIPFHECWEWSGARTSSAYQYGSIGVNGVTRGAHRVSWELHNGPIPIGLEICHKCDNPGCVRPDHLFLGTHADNIRDARDKGKMNHPHKKQTHCRKGHERVLGQPQCRVCVRANQKLHAASRNAARNARRRAKRLQ